MARTVVKRYGIGIQVTRWHYMDESNNRGFMSAYAPLTIGFHRGHFTFKIKKPKTVKP